MEKVIKARLAAKKATRSGDKFGVLGLSDRKVAPLWALVSRALLKLCAIHGVSPLLSNLALTHSLHGVTYVQSWRCAIELLARFPLSSARSERKSAYLLAIPRYYFDMSRTVFFGVSVCGCFWHVRTRALCIMHTFKLSWVTTRYKTGEVRCVNRNWLPPRVSLIYFSSTFTLRIERFPHSKGVLW